MKQQFRSLTNEPFIRKMIKVFALIMLSFVIIAIWKWSYLPPQLPLFYSLPRNNDQLASPLLLLMLPFFSIMIFAVNYLIAVSIFDREKLGSTIIVIISNIIAFLLLTTFIKIIFLVT